MCALGTLRPELAVSLWQSDIYICWQWLFLHETKLVWGAQGCMAVYICVSIALEVIFLCFSDWCCKVQNLRKNKPLSTLAPAGASVLQKRILGFLVNIRLNMSQCCALVQRGPAASYAVLGNVARKSMEFIITFYSGLLRLCLEYWVQQWAP